MLCDGVACPLEEQDSKAPSDRFIGVAVSSLAVLTLPFIPWLILVTLFRRSYIKRKGRNGGSKFLLFWSKMKRYLQVRCRPCRG